MKIITTIALLFLIVSCKSEIRTVNTNNYQADMMYPQVRLVLEEDGKTVHQETNLVITNVRKQ